jgi:predicted CxxxxCH...CXXCH cytochrome family protein
MLHAIAMNTRAFFSATLVILGLGGLACGSSQTVSETGGQATSCTACHGGQDNMTGAPPFDTNGRSDPALASVGAHTAHVQAGALAGAFGCDACHPAPGPNHGSGTVQVSFGALSTANGTVSPVYNGSYTSCASTYCHGAFAEGNPTTVPVWTKGASQAACGSCHGDPAVTPSALPRVHVRLAAGSTNATCSICHPATVRADGTIDVAGGKHVDGQRQTDPAAIHPASWMTAAYTDPGFHGIAANQQGIAACLRCHAKDAPASVTTITCNGCHNFFGFPIP